MTRSLVASTVLAVALFAPAASAQSVIVVDDSGGPGVDFTTLAAAVVAAADGDTILLRTGEYGPTTVDAKSLIVVRDAPAGTVTLANLVVRNLGADQSFTLRGVEMTSFSLPGTPLRVLDSAGPVLIEDCAILLGNPGLVIDGSDGVFVSRCSIEGSNHFVSGFFNLPGGDGIEATDSAFAVYDSTVAAGDGAVGIVDIETFEPSGNGGIGIRMVDSQATIAGSTVTGGNGGDGFISFVEACMDPGFGGNGLKISGDARAILCVGADASVTAGANGNPAPGCVFIALQPNDVDVTPPAVVVTPSYTARSYSVDAPVRGGQSATFSFDGVAGDSALLLISFVPGYLKVPGMADVLFPDLATLAIIPVGILPPGGQLSFAAAVPLFPAGVETATIYTQAAFLAPGANALSGASALVLVNQAF